MANIYRFVAEWSLLGDDHRQIGLHFLAEEAEDEGDVEIRFDALWQAMDQTHTAALVLTAYHWYEGPVATSTGWEWGDTFRTTPRALSGNDPFTTVMLPPQCAVVVSFPVPADVRRHRGRVYWPAPSASAISQDGRYAKVPELADAWLAFLNGCAADGWSPCVLAKVTGSGGAPTMIRIRELRVNDVVDTQRRRGYETPLQSVSRTVTNP